MKIVFFGDSLTWGGYGGNFVDEVAKRLPDHEIINAGEGGNTVINLTRRLERDVLSHQPDGVFLMVGGNDSTSYSQPQTRIYYEQVQKLDGGYVSPLQFSQHYRDLLNRLLLEHIQVWIGLQPKEQNPDTVRAMREYNDIARDIARSLNLPVLDLDARLSPKNPDEVPPRSPLNLATINLIGKRISQKWNDYETERQKGGYTYSFDGIHFTPETAVRVAEWIVEFLDL
jgi:lysophospholipase L1-like esterase